MQFHKEIVIKIFIKIYIDENEINERIEITAYCLNLNVFFKRYLKSEKHYTVYLKKLKRINMICQLTFNVNLNI